MNLSLEKGALMRMLTFSMKDSIKLNLEGDLRGGTLFFTKKIVVSGITGLSSILINRTLLKDVNPMIKYGSGIILGGTLAYSSKNKIVKQAGIGLLVSNSLNWIFEAIQKNHETEHLEIRRELASPHELVAK